MGASPRLIFAPEHGLEATAQAEEAVGSEAAEGKTPIFSLYGKTKEALTPAAEQLAEIDLLLIDLADVGSRYYTYAWTALLARAPPAQLRFTRSCSIARIRSRAIRPRSKVRPSRKASCPSSGWKRCRFGMRSASVSCWLSSWSVTARRWAPKVRCPWCRCWVGNGIAARKRGGGPFVMPSPNMPHCRDSLVYPGGCLVEGTN